MPDYAFLPGINLHPNKRLQKHLPDISCGENSLNAESWQLSSCYLYAIDLFNQTYYWEVHEVLEHLWIKAGKKSETALFLKGIIQLSVALLKVKTGNLYGAKRLHDKAIPLLQRKETVYLGIDVPKLIEDFKCFIAEKGNVPTIVLA